MHHSAGACVRQAETDMRQLIQPKHAANPVRMLSKNTAVP
jgi:hypothetical protein